LRHLLKLRYLAVVVVLVAILHGLTFLFLGLRTAWEAYAYVFTGHEPAPGKQPVLELLHALDFVLVALVMIILALGVAKLFLSDDASDKAGLPRWLHIETFVDLKVLLWETILMALLIIGLSALTSGVLGSKLDWNALVMPAAILLLALSLYFMKRA
jgi:uncharacterized membrane protein YqhA